MRKIIGEKELIERGRAMKTLKWEDSNRKPSVIYIAVEQGKIDKSETKMDKPRKYFICADDLMDMRYFVRQYYVESEGSEKTIDDFAIMKLKINNVEEVKFKEAKNFTVSIADKPLRLYSGIEYELIDVFRVKGM